MYTDFTVSIYAMGALMAAIGFVILIKQIKQDRHESTRSIGRGRTYGKN